MRHTVIDAYGNTLDTFEGEVPRKNEMITLYGEDQSETNFLVSRVTWEVSHGKSIASVMVDRVNF